MTIIVISFYIIFSIKNIALKIASIVVAVIIGCFVIFIDFFVCGLNTEDIDKLWKINNYEIIYAREQYFAGPGSEPYLKLREKYLFGLFYIDSDKTHTKYTYLEIGDVACFVEFKRTNTKFDLCKHKQLK